MSFDSENLHECEELVYICTQFFPDFFFMFYYFLNFAKKKGAGEPGSRKSALRSSALPGEEDSLVETCPSIPAREGL